MPNVLPTARPAPTGARAGALVALCGWEEAARATTTPERLAPVMLALSMHRCVLVRALAGLCI